MKRHIFAISIICLLVPKFAQAAPEFLAYEGKGAIHEGEGGNKKVVNGIDFWIHGDPPRKYQILGELDDRRHKTGIVGMVRMAGLDEDIARAAKAVGGDAVLLQDASDDVVGVAGYGNSYTTGYAATRGRFQANTNHFGGASAIMKHNSTYVVVKYLPSNEVVKSATDASQSVEPQK
jgi:hypothetical protein